MSILKLGPDEPYFRSERKVWIAVDSAQNCVQHGSDLILGRECSSLAQLEEVAKIIRADLDAAIVLARKRLTERG